MKLDEILKNYMHIPEVKAIVDEAMAYIASIEPISLDELEDLPEPESMETEELEKLLPRLDKLHGELGDAEPEDEDSGEYEEWEIGISYVADLYDEIDSVIAKRKKQQEQ